MARLTSGPATDHASTLQCKQAAPLVCTCTSSPQTQRCGWNAARIASLLLSLRSSVARGVEVARASGMLCMDRCAIRRATPCARGSKGIALGASGVPLEGLWGGADGGRQQTTLWQSTWRAGLHGPAGWLVIQPTAHRQQGCLVPAVAQQRLALQVHEGEHRFKLEQTKQVG